MNEPVVFLLREHAADFVSRDLGRKVRNQLLEFELGIAADVRIDIDATGVDIMNPQLRRRVLWTDSDALRRRTLSRAIPVARHRR